MKPKVLTFVAYYLPGYKFGGPVRTIANMVEHLGDELDFRIVTRDRDALDTAPYPGIQVDGWNRVGKALVFYASPRTLTLRGVGKLIRQTPHDVLYLNSFFNPHFTILPLLVRRLGLIPRRPCVIAPRGEFSPGALKLKAWKKRPYLWLARALGLYSGLTWQASSDQEAEEIRRALGRVADRIMVAPDLPSLVSAQRLDQRIRTEDGPLRVVFLSRITPMKNLDYALRVLGQVRVPVEFNIYGPVWDGTYWRECERLMQVLPPHIKAEYRGEVPPEDVPEVFLEHDLFFFPTRGENFGHVILESLSVGTPVLISDQTPWTDDGTGACTVWSLEAPLVFVVAIEQMAKLSEEERQRIRFAALAMAKKFIERSDLKERSLQLFREAGSEILGGGST